METISGATFSFDHQGEPDLIGNEPTGGSYRVMLGQRRPHVPSPNPG
jgi:hypothetical protein